MTPAPDIAAVTAAMRETALREILPRFRRLEDDDMWRKKAGSLATVADMAAEKRLSGALGKLVPGARILAEEDVETNPAALDYLADDDPLWVIDPIDGTANFAAGREGFVIIVAYFAGGEVRAGWIHDPLGDVTVTAEAGAGLRWRRRPMPSATCVARCVAAWCGKPRWRRISAMCSALRAAAPSTWRSPTAASISPTTAA